MSEQININCGYAITTEDGIYMWHHKDGVQILDATTEEDAIAEVEFILNMSRWETDPDDEDVFDVDYDESMDGDFDSAMASAGWGTDEDYGCYDEC